MLIKINLTRHIYPNYIQKSKVYASTLPPLPSCASSASVNRKEFCAGSQWKTMLLLERISINPYAAYSQEVKMVDIVINIHTAGITASLCVSKGRAQ